MIMIADAVLIYRATCYHLTYLNVDGLVINLADTVHDGIDFSKDLMCFLHTLRLSVCVTDGDLTLDGQRVIGHVQHNRHLCTEILMAWEDGTFGDRFQQAGLASAAATNNNDTWQLKILLH